MTVELLSVLSAAALAVAGVGAPAAETRSAEALPAQHLVTAQLPARSGKAIAVRHLADAEVDTSDQGSCSKDSDPDDKNRKCKAGAWWNGPDARVPIILATAAGIAFAVGGSDGNSVSH